jgi:leucyl aminopeptidase (aminopeptidase T)/predicted transcriptional regulator
MKDVFFISNTKAIKTLSSERRLRILHCLVDREYAAQDLAEILKLKTNVIWYDVKQLEEAGLIELMHTEQIRGATKKYYRTVAKNFFVDVSLGKANLNKSKKIQNLVSQEIEDWQREKIIKINFKDLASNIVNQSLGIKENEVVAISYQPMHQKLVEDLMVEIARKGAYAIPIFWTKRIEYNFIKNVPLKYACKDVIDDFLLDKIDAHIIFSGEFLEEPDEIPLTPELIEKGNLVEQSKRENVRKTYQTNVRFLTIDTLQKRQIQDLDTNVCREMYWKSLNIEPDSFHNECEFVQRKLQSAKNIEITDGIKSKLNISLSNPKRIEIKEGIANSQSSDSELPGGMVVGLLENGSIEGEFHTDFAYLFDKKFEDVFIKIEEGKLTKIVAQKNNQELQKMFNNADGDKDVIGSFCIGLNPEIYKNIGHPYINSKIYGAISLQVGWDELEASQIDSDMIAQFFMLNKTITVDGKILFKDGKLYK